MFRIPQQVDNEALASKINMLQSNVTRLLNQNRKLQVLLQSSDQFDRLREFVSIVQQNWTKVNALTLSISQIHEQIKQNQKLLHTKANHCNEYISANILGEMQKIKTKTREHQARVDEAKGRMKLRAKKDLQGLKLKFKKELACRMEDSVKIIQKCETSLRKQLEESFVPEVVASLTERFEDKNESCRVQLGQLHNLVLYKIHVEREHQESGQQDEYQRLGTTMYSLIEDSCSRMNNNMENMELKLKKVSSEVSWLKNQIRIRKKTSNNDSFTVNDRPGNLILSEMKQQLEDMKIDSLGLGKYCDRLLLIRRVMRGAMPKGQSETQEKRQAGLLEGSKSKMLGVRERMTKLTTKFEELSLFYRQF